MAITKLSEQSKAPAVRGKVNELVDAVNGGSSGSGSGGGSISTTSRTVKVKMQGGIMTNGYIKGAYSSEDDFMKYCHSVLMMNIEGCSISAVETQSGETLTIFYYGPDGSYLGRATSISGIDSSACFVKFMLNKSTAYTTDRILSVEVSGVPRFVKNRFPSLGAMNHFAFETSETYQPEPDGTIEGNNGSGNTTNTNHYLGSNKRVFDNGFLMLPPNYTPDGPPVPLAVFCHGTTGYSGMATTTHTYTDYLPFVVNNGYAVADCSGLTSDNPFEATCALGMPSHKTSIVNMVKFLMDNYNLRDDGVYLFGKSSGGFVCHMLAYLQPFKVKAVASLNPAICLLTSQMNHVLQKLNTVKATGLQIGAPVDFDTSGATASGMSWNSEVQEYFIANISRWRQIDAFFQGTDLTDAQVADIINGCYDKGAASPKKIDYGMDVINAAKRWVNCPTMIWSDPKDDAVAHDTILKYTQMAQRTGSPVYLRTMPYNSGQHHSTDTASNAIKTTYKPKYSDAVEVPVAYAELVDWFNRW